MVVATMEEEVQEELEPDQEMAMMTMTANQRKQNLPLIVQVKLKEQQMTK